MYISEVYLCVHAWICVFVISAAVCVCLCMYLCVCMHVLGCMRMREWDKKEKESFRGAFLLRSVPICSPGPNCSWVRRHGKKGRKATVLIPCPRVISVTLKEHHQQAPDYCHVNNGTWLDSPLMNVIYFSKRGLIIDRGPLSPPTGSTSQLAAKRWLLIFVFFKYDYIYVRVHMFLWHGE